MFLRRVIILESFLCFDGQCHKQAWPKFVILWLCSSLPVIIAVLLMPKVVTSDAKEDSSFWTGISKFFEAISGSFTAAELFVYSAAFLSPLLYLFYERVRETEVSEGDNFRKRASLSMRHLFDGFWLIFLLAVIVFCITVFSYVVNKVNPDVFKDTYLYSLAESTTLFCYGFSLMCLYLSILDGFKDKGGSNFVLAQRTSEDSIVTDFGQRVGSRGNESAN